MADLFKNPRFRLALIASVVMLILLISSAALILQRAGGGVPIAGDVVYLSDKNIYEIGTESEAVANQLNDEPVRNLVVSADDTTLFWILENNFGVRQRIGSNENFITLSLCDLSAEICEYLVPAPNLERLLVDNQQINSGRDFIQFYGRNGGRQLDLPISSDGDIRWINDEALVYRHSGNNTLRVYQIGARRDINFRTEVIEDDWALTPDNQNALIITPDTLQPLLISLDFEGGAVNGQLEVPIGDGTATYRMGAANWNPNNTYVVLTGNNTEFVYLDPFAPSTTQTILTATCTIEAEDWHPSGRFLLYTEDCGNSSQIMILDMQTGDTRNVSTGTTPRWVNTNG